MNITVQWLLIDKLHYLHNYRCVSGNFQQNHIKGPILQPWSQLKHFYQMFKEQLFSRYVLRYFPVCSLYQKKDYRKHIFVQAGITELFDSEVKWKMQQYDIEQDLWTSSIVTASRSIKFGGLTAVIKGDVFHIPQTHNDLKISQIMLRDNYTQRLLLHQGTVDVFPSQEAMHQIVSVFYSRKYMHYYCV